MGPPYPAPVIRLRNILSPSRTLICTTGRWERRQKELPPSCTRRATAVSLAGMLTGAARLRCCGVPAGASVEPASPYFSSWRHCLNLSLLSPLFRQMAALGHLRSAVRRLAPVLGYWVLRLRAFGLTLAIRVLKSPRGFLREPIHFRRWTIDRIPRGFDISRRSAATGTRLPARAAWARCPAGAGAARNRDERGNQSMDSGAEVEFYR
jgi:hypothetical protein